MKQYFKYQKQKSWLMLVMMTLVIFAGSFSISAKAWAQNIVVLYTNDVHCGLMDCLGYKSLAVTRNALQAEGNAVFLVDNGDAIQGDYPGFLSKGAAIVDIMNDMGYDCAIPGNHEFDYGLANYLKLSQRAKFPYLAANFTYADGQPVFKPYIIKEAAGKKIAFVGVTTPQTISITRQSTFKDAQGKLVYDMKQSQSGQELYNCVQQAVQSARAEGADYIILMTHLGVGEAFHPWASTDVIAHTAGIDAVLDGHSHSIIPGQQVNNIKGEPVLLSSTGTKLAYIGMLTITPDGNISTRLIDDSGIGTAVKNTHDKYKNQVEEFIARSDFPLLAAKPDGTWLVRHEETNLANLCTDALCSYTGTSIGILNAGHLRKNMPAGDIKYKDILGTVGMGNQIGVIEVTGQQLLDALELGASKSPEENGALLHVSGITYTIDLNTTPAAALDENGCFHSKGGKYRVQNVMINNQPINLQQKYQVAGSDYILRDGGNGMTMFKDAKVVREFTSTDIEMLKTYLQQTLHGKVTANYAEPQHRITIKK